MGTMIIAEAGVNHNGSLALAIKMVDAAKEAGADYIKFQTFIPEELVTKTAVKAVYQKKETGTEQNQLQMLEELALSQCDFITLQRYCKQIGIGFASSPFDFGSIELLEEFNMDFWKVPSGEITNLPYLERIGKTGRKVILSTGMCEMSDIREALSILGKSGAGEITLLHCNTEYPTPFGDVNLLAMVQLRKVFAKPVGYSDHTIGIEIPIAAVALGAETIEKHFTLDKTMEGPDQSASLEPSEFKRMVQAIRNIEQGMGDGIKRCSESEKKNCGIVRKSIVAKCSIKAGDIFTERNLTVKRPGDGISPMRWYDFLGRASKRDYQPDELIRD